MKKIIALVLVLILAAAVLAACGATVSGDDGNYNHGNTKVTEKISHLKASWTAGHMYVQYHDEDYILVEETSDRDIPEDEQVRWRVDGDMLEIIYQKPGLVKFSTLSKDLTVKLPKALLLEKAELISTSAEIDAPDLKAKDVLFGSTSGTVQLKTSAETVNGSTTSGGITLKTSGEAKSVTLDSTSGEVYCMAEKPETVKISTTSGGIILEAEKVGKATLHSVSGDVMMSAPEFSEIDIDTTSGSVRWYTKDEPGFTATITTVSGSVESELALAVSGRTYTCGDGSAAVKIKTVSGGVKVYEKK